MSSFENSAQREGKPGLVAFHEAIKNVLTTSPEVLNAFADNLESELSSMDDERRKRLISTAIEALRVAGREVIIDMEPN